MKCANCGAELKVGCIYCSVCGHEAQIVPDYNIMEDDLLKSLLKEESKEKKKEPDATEKPDKKVTNVKPRKKKKNRMPIMIAIAIIFLVALVGIFFFVKDRQNHSFTYQYSHGLEALSDKDYTSAINYLKRALELDEDNTDVMLTLAKVYEKREDDASEEANLLQITELDAENKDAYKMLIELYDSQKKYDKITDLYEKLKNTKLKSLFYDYIVVSPEFSEEPGTYSEEMKLDITAQDGCEIYYSLGDEDPIQSGTLYEDSIQLKEGDTTVNAVAKDERGIYSDVVTADYTIAFQSPQEPSVTPKSGSYTQAQQITIDVPSGCTAYYTWDGSNPSNESAAYAGPLEMPVGNNVLSIIVINGHDLASKVVRYNYIYLPE